MPSSLAMHILNRENADADNNSHQVFESIPYYQQEYIIFAVFILSNSL
ncbi:hypothetical protein KKB18_07075 [bacterium]|nr:hypothetical protein [bacterium]